MANRAGNAKYNHEQIVADILSCFVFQFGNTCFTVLDLVVYGANVAYDVLVNDCPYVIYLHCKFLRQALIYSALS